MILCDYGCGQEARYQFKNGKWCCSAHANKCSYRKKLISKKTKEEMTKIIKLENNITILCSYGCGHLANYLFQYNNKFCCEKVNSKCPQLKEKTSNSHIGMGHTEKTKKRLKEWAKERFSVKENCTFYGKHHTEESKLKIGLQSKDRECKEETRKKMSLMRCGNKNANWKGGVSLEPYCFEFTQDLKEFVKERDSFTCKNPNCSNGNHLCVHHIDYNKKNCISENLITLCFSCNSKANFNRDYWVGYYNSILKEGD